MDNTPLLSAAAKDRDLERTHHIPLQRPSVQVCFLEPRDRTVVQQALLALGHYKGNIDGVIGPLSRDAIRRFQSGNGYPVTGRLTHDQFNQLLAIHQLEGDLNP